MRFASKRRRGTPVGYRERPSFLPRRRFGPWCAWRGCNGSAYAACRIETLRLSSSRPQPSAPERSKAYPASASMRFTPDYSLGSAKRLVRRTWRGALQAARDAPRRLAWRCGTGRLILEGWRLCFSSPASVRTARTLRVIFNLTQRGVSRRGALLFRRCHDRIHEKLTEFKSE